MRRCIGWASDAAVAGVGFGGLGWLLWGGTLTQVLVGGAFYGAFMASAWWWRGSMTPGRRLVKLPSRVVRITSTQPKRLRGTVRWWKDEKGYGRISGDDGYLYFCHFSALPMRGYKSLRKGQRVEFERFERIAAHRRAGAVNVCVIDDERQA